MSENVLDNPIRLKILPVWCVVKAAKAFNRDGELVGVMKFGQQGWVLEEKDDRLFVTFLDCPKYREKVQIKGWINKRGVSHDMVVDQARLPYRNITGKPVPVAKIYKGQAVGTIAPGKIVSMIAFCGEWCLTSCGWTKRKWFKKEPIDHSQDSIRALSTGILVQAVKDYRNAINRIRKGKCQDEEDFGAAYCEIASVIRWFGSENYMIWFDDKGKDKLDWLNKAVGLDEKWLKDKKRIYDELCVKGRIRKR